MRRIKNLHQKLYRSLIFTLYFSYADIASVVWGDQLANVIKNSCMVMECTMICVLYIVVVGDLFTKAIENVEGISPLSHKMVCIIATATLVPCIFLKDLKVTKKIEF